MRLSEPKYLNRPSFSALYALLIKENRLSGNEKVALTSSLQFGLRDEPSTPMNKGAASAGVPSSRRPHGEDASGTGAAEESKGRRNIAKKARRIVESDERMLGSLWSRSVLSSGVNHQEWGIPMKPHSIIRSGTNSDRLVGRRAALGNCAASNASRWRCGYLRSRVRITARFLKGLMRRDIGRYAAGGIHGGVSSPSRRGTGRTQGLATAKGHGTYLSKRFCRASSNGETTTK